MSTSTLALRAMAHRTPVCDGIPAVDAERLGDISTPTGRALLVVWPETLRRQGLLPARLWLHKGSDSDTNLLGWASVGICAEIWLVSQGGRVDAYKLGALRAHLLSAMRGPQDTHRFDIVQDNRHQRRVYRTIPVRLVEGAHIGTFFP